MITRHILVTYDVTLFDSTLHTYDGRNNALLYSRRTDGVCEFLSVVKSFKKAAVAFSRAGSYVNALCTRVGDK